MQDPVPLMLLFLLPSYAMECNRIYLRVILCTKTVKPASQFGYKGLLWPWNIASSIAPFNPSYSIKLSYSWTFNLFSSNIVACSSLLFLLLVRHILGPSSRHCCHHQPSACAKHPWTSSPCGSICFGFPCQWTPLQQRIQAHGSFASLQSLVFLYVKGLR